MSADSPPPSPTAPSSTPDQPEDAVAAFQRDLFQLRSAPPAADFVDPHLTDAAATSPDDVTAVSPESDVDPGTRFQDGPAPSEADLIAGDEVPVTAADPADPTDPSDPSDPSDCAMRSAPSAHSASQRAKDGQPQGPQDGQLSGLQNAQSATLETERRQLDQTWRKGVRESLPAADLERMENRIAEIDTLLPQARAAELDQARQRQQARETSATQAATLYPDAGREGTPLAQRMTEIRAALEANADPLLNDPAHPLVIAQMAARDLRIAPVHRPQSTAHRSPATGNRSAATNTAHRPMTAPLTGPSQRPAAPVPHPAERAIDQIQTAEQYETLLHSLRRGSQAPPSESKGLRTTAIGSRKGPAGGPDQPR